MRSHIPALLVVGLVVAACGGETTDTTTTAAAADTTTTTAAVTTTAADTTTTTAPATTTTDAADPYAFDIVIEGSTVTGGGRVSVPLGETVTLRFTSDVADEIHIHGYDIYVDLETGVTAEVSFTADIPGLVEVETHNSSLVVANLEAS
ncbi:MAG TPA: hypothetical protein VMS74_07300 [Acidimicrobiia bacterium]|nr:hypothetical protein [Acidimicrobiia bacterium]